MNAHSGGRGVTLSLHNKGVGGQRHVSPALSWERDPVHTAQEAGQARSRSGQVRKIPPGINSRTVQPLPSCNTDYASVSQTL